MVAIALGFGTSVMMGSRYDPSMGYGLDYGQGNLNLSTGDWITSQRIVHMQEADSLLADFVTQNNLNSQCPTDHGNVPAPLTCR